MLGLVVFGSSLVLPLVHLYFSREPRTRFRVVEVFLLYALVLNVGVIGFPLGFIPHVFFPDWASAQIGWSPSPFEFEVGFHDGAWGVLGFLCIWIGAGFWLATGLGWSFFILGAAYLHLYHVVYEGDYAPYNFITMFSDALIGIWLLALLFLFVRWGGLRTPTLR